MTSLQVDTRASGSGDLCREMLRTLPEWFGVPASNESYAEVAERNVSAVARLDGRDIGLLTLVRHTPVAAEIAVMAVAPAHHRRGVGRALLAHSEHLLTRDGAHFLQVKTLSSRRDYEPYARTRAFYLGNGFEPLQEFPDLWNLENPALQLIKCLLTW